MAQALIPGAIKFTIARETIRILDADLALSFQNGCTYQECMTKTGIKSYVLAKGTCITQNGDVVATIIKTPDGKQDGSIKNLQDNLKQVQKSNNPADYAKDVAVIIENPSSEKFLDVTFKGYVSEFNTQPPDSTGFTTYQATVVVYDPLTIEVKN
jgi:hypothetical protein